MMSPSGESRPPEGAPPGESRAKSQRALRGGLGTSFSRLGERLARSSRVFLLGLLVACGIEVAVDWNSTLFEINVLRERMRQRGKNYASILTHAALAPLLTKDRPSLEILADGLFDDEDVLYVRFSDVEHRILYDRLRRGSPRSEGFLERYSHQMDRDTKGILLDPKGLAARIVQSRHRDFFQVYNDFVDGVVHLFVARKPLIRPGGSLVLYQDRLYDEQRHHIKDVTYAIGALLDTGGVPRGIALVAFSMDRTNEAIQSKLIKGAGIVLFFVTLILVQNILSRRDKLRLLDLEARHAAAKRALRDALEEVPTGPALSAGAALSQAPGSVDGMVFGSLSRPPGLEFLVVDPDGDGIDAASVSLHVLNTYRARSASHPAAAPLPDELAALGEAARAIPLTRPVSLLLLRIDAESGRLEGLASGPLAELRILDEKGVRTVESSPLGEAPRGVVGPLRSFSGALEPRGSFLGFFSGGRRAGERPRDPAGSVADFVARRSRGGASAPAELAADAVSWARGHLGVAADGDLVVFLARRGT
jgi:hypothetical protein